MKQIIIGIFCLAVFNSIAADSVYWFLGAAMTKPGKKLVKKFNKMNSEDKVLLVTGGSGDLLSRIVMGHSGGFYTPGSRKFLKIAQKKDVVDSYTPFIKQEAVFAYRNSKVSKDISFKDICSGKYEVVSGNPQVMALGGLFEKFKHKLSLSSQKKLKNRPLGISAVQIVNYIKNGNASVGFLFKPITRINKLKYVEIPEEYKVFGIADFILLKNTRNKKLVEKFKKFVFKNRKIFKNYGFEIL
ncbi:MAG: substrate-binding domain-containing protein [Victivallales bacterium]|nr:substrate-binding domain-containing protein [Victivallales bacterium]